VLGRGRDANAPPAVAATGACKQKCAARKRQAKRTTASGSAYAAAEAGRRAAALVVTAAGIHACMPLQQCANAMKGTATRSVEGTRTPRRETEP